MEYISTRSNREPIKGSQAILRGISPDGGLYLPKALPLIDNLEDLLSLNYRQMALYVLKKFFPELGKERLKNAVNKAYDEKFSAGPVKIRRTKQVNFLELYHGPTLAFKDMALALLPHLLKASKDLENIKEDIIILTATSGDTGKAALEGFANVEGVKIIVFYPKEGVSQVQELQMVTQEGKNTLVVGVKGNFDDTQSGVKTIFNDVDFKERLRENNYIFSSANSINIGRLVPQIIYYIYAYCQMVNKGDISLGERINIVVPTGNFGNILAAYYAKRMGLPVNKLICASNDNNVLTEFLNKRRYDIRRDLILSSSPSMDILISSNLERLIFHLNQKDHQLVKDKMDELEI
ncbi:MAG TPA: threonine synthase, partial [Tissierellaceae bacterium]|nr:threonine synthase [Tissierellaceae bacterium]